MTELERVQVQRLSDENKKMAEYLLYLNECNKIPLVRDGFGWLLIKEDV